MELFPDIGVELGKLTTVSISQRTKNDMSAWSPEVEDEREEMLKNVCCVFDWKIYETMQEFIWPIYQLNVDYDKNLSCRKS